MTTATMLAFTLIACRLIGATIALSAAAVLFVQSGLVIAATARHAIRRHRRTTT